MRHKSSFKILKLTLKNTNNKILKSIYNIVVDENYLAIISLLTNIDPIKACSASKFEGNVLPSFILLLSGFKLSI